MAQYGSMYRLCDFIDKLIPSGGSGDFSDLFVHRALTFLKTISEIQEKNAWVTLTVQAGDGIWVAYKGDRLFLILPAQSFFRIIIGREERRSVKPLVEALEKAVAVDEAQDTQGENEYRQWRVFEILLVSKFLEGLAKPSIISDGDQNHHPRTFPGSLRQAELERFERNGCICPGVGRAAHKVDLNSERIEFDHILPWSKGGPSSDRNIQVLCQTCNATKRNTAIGAD